MSRRESWCPVAEEVYRPRGVRLPVRMVQHHHTCPDGTLVRVDAQYIDTTGVTLYRWRVGGVRRRGWSVSGDQREVAPDWSLVDDEFRAVA